MVTMDTKYDQIDIRPTMVCSEWEKNTRCRSGNVILYIQYILKKHSVIQQLKLINGAYIQARNTHLSCSVIRILLINLRSITLGGDVWGNNGGMWQVILL